MVKRTKDHFLAHKKTLATQSGQVVVYSVGHSVSFQKDSSLGLISEESLPRLSCRHVLMKNGGSVMYRMLPMVLKTGV